MQYFSAFNSPLGNILCLSDGISLTGIYFQNHKPCLVFDKSWICNQNLKIFDATKIQFLSFLNAKRKEFEIPLTYIGTKFQRSVWAALSKIPYGKTVSYTEIAEEIGNADGVRAVASAISRNPISVVIPCHRVISKNGTISGYAGGIQRKLRLLKLEKGF